MTKGNLIIVSAPSGAGKSSLVHHALNRVAGVCYSVSYTTRPGRGAEVNGVDYHFVSNVEFLRMRDSGEFLEYAEVHGFFYGTHRAATEKLINEGVDVLLDIDVQGAAQIKKQMPEAVTVFILPPSRDILEARLRARQLNSEAEVARRLYNATQEVRRCHEFQYVIVNDELARACAALEAIILAERYSQNRQSVVAENIISTFGG
ncbi:MAG: guanylate kinase [Acidobacteria bacterium]|nr:guanylate kinase [Acidobacteriota bacterium]